MDKLSKEEIAQRVKEGYTSEAGYFVKPEMVNPVTGLRKKSGGRQKGTKNKFTNVDRATIKLVREHDNRDVTKFLDKNATPLAYLTHVYNDVNEDKDHRLKAAIASLSYVHGKKPNQLELSGRDGKDLNLGNDNALKALEGLLIGGVKQIEAESEEESQQLLDEYDAETEYTVVESYEVEQSSTEKAEDVLARARDYTSKGEE